MRGMTEKEFNRQMKILERENEERRRYQEYRDERNKYRPRMKLPTTSKLILAAMIFMCAEIIIFCEWAMMTTYDTNSMYALIAIPAALAPTLWAYYSKAKAENSEGGITYDMAMAQLKMNNEISDEAGVEAEPEATAEEVFTEEAAG